MIIKQLTRDSAEAIFVVAQNASGSTVSVGTALCWDWRNAASHGVAVVAPTASTIGLFAGVAAYHQPSYADWPANNYGLVQVYGVHGSVAFSIANTSVSCAGDWLVPAVGMASLAYVDISGGGMSRYSMNLLVARGAWMMSNHLSAKGWSQAFVRAL